MKEFKIRDDEKQSLDRLKQEIEVLQQNRPGLPKLLGFDIQERWMVTEYLPNGTLEDHIEEYGNSALALKAFRSVVATIALLHNENKVHRDIKPANIFIGKEHDCCSATSGWSTSRIAGRASPAYTGRPWELAISSLR